VTIVQANPQINSAGGEGVKLAGFVSIDTSGGAGSVDGGDAGPVAVRQLGGTVQPGGDPRLDSVLSQAEVSAVGGAGAAGIGGAGGDVAVETASGPTSGSAKTDRSAVNEGAVDVSGGDGADGGAAGSLVVYDHYAATNRGALTADG
jgi:hypothetical protein